MKNKFIEFLTEKFSRSEIVGKAYSKDEEMVEHFLSGEVTIPIPLVLEFIEWLGNYLPSQFQIGDRVLLDFGNQTPLEVNILAIHFTISKVKYDLEILLAKNEYTRIYNVDSCFVIPQKIK